MIELSMQATSAGDSQQRDVCVSDYRVCEPKEDGGHGGEGFIASWRTSCLLVINESD